MQIIALTSANEAAMAHAAELLLAASTTRGLQLSVLIGIATAHEARAVYSGHGELWRIGVDDTRPELDALVDRTLRDHPPARLEADVAYQLSQFLNKKAVAV